MNTGISSMSGGKCGKSTWEVQQSVPVSLRIRVTLSPQQSIWPTSQVTKLSPPQISLKQVRMSGCSWSCPERSRDRNEVVEDLQRPSAAFFRSPGGPQRNSAAGTSGRFEHHAWQSESSHT